MRLAFWLVLLLWSGMVLQAQDGSNPFELTPRLDPAAQVVEEEPVETADPADTNPFEVGATTEAPATSVPAPTGNPFDVAVGEEEPVEEVAPLEELLPEMTDSGDGTRLLISLLMLTLTALSLLFFRSLYLKCYRALFNDNLLSQLYREREAGALGSFLLTYLLFFIAAGFFIAQVGAYWKVLPAGQLGYNTLMIMAGVAGLLLFKHLVLAIIGYVFPIGKETRRYSFAIMVFWIIGGLILSAGGLLLSYAPEGSELILIGVTLAGLLILFLLRTLRGFFIANRFIFNSQFHFLSYICAVEIGPALCFLKFLTDFQ